MLVTQRQSFDPTSSHRHTSSYPYGTSLMYAIPAYRQNGRGGGPGTDGLSYAEHELLRSRKTPHGRIDERFDAASLDRNTYIPASKHLLLSTSPLAPDKQRYTSRSRSGPTFNGEELADGPYRGTHERNAYSLPGNNLPYPVRDLVVGVDSAFHPTLSAGEQHLYYQPRSQIPTALPASLQVYLGPPVSAGQQFYGPYWPDGTFTPYRPAPVRDSRFFGPAPGSSYPQQTHVPDFHTLRRPGKLPMSRNASTITPDYVASPGQNGLQDNPSLFTRIVPLATSGNAAVHQRPWEKNTNVFWSNQASSELLVEDPANRYKDRRAIKLGDASARLAFRDRSFSWAYQTYVELLGRIQLESRAAKPLQGASAHSRIPAMKPTIFPKPPQRSGSYLKDFTPSSEKAPSKVGRLVPTIEVHGAEDLPERPRTAIHSTSWQDSSQDTQSNLTPIKQSRLVPVDMQQTTYIRPTSVTDENVYQPQPTQCSPSPSLAAISALERMELLCNEASTPWTDGMLLAGCLAYGLGDYVRALSWYQKVLAQDPRHVEAISNQAATLLALGRRDEALQNWSLAVKLRPSYFEALEHLVGLLCTSNRAKEAIEMIQYVESCLKLPTYGEATPTCELTSDGESDTRSQTSSTTTGASNEQAVFEYEVERRMSTSSVASNQQAIGFGSSGYAVVGAENGRLLALIHAKGNMLYSLGHNSAAAETFEDAILVATGYRQNGIRGLIKHILCACVSRVEYNPQSMLDQNSKEPILLSPDRAQQIATRMFPPTGELPGLEHVARGVAYRAAISTTSNSLLSLAKIYQDGMGSARLRADKKANGTREILALYYLSLSLQPSPSTANNVGILLASVQQATTIQVVPQCNNNHITNYAGIAPGSGVALALQYYNYGLNIDSKHAHLYTNLGSLLKDLGQLNSAIKMYEIAVSCDGSFDIALANLANAVKDQGRIADAIGYYRRAVQANPDFAEAVCGLATALNSVCNWYGRGGVYADNGLRDRIHVDEQGKIQEARRGCGWMNRVVEIVDKQLKDGEIWGVGTLTPSTIEQVCQQLSASKSHLASDAQQQFYQQLQRSLQDWSGKRWEGSRIVKLVERAIKKIGWQWYHDRYRLGKDYPTQRYARPHLPATLSSPTVPTVLPFHTFTTPLSAKQVRQISQRNALRISVAALRSPWLPLTVYPPPRPPSPYLKVGYISSDFNNHPLAHLMQSVFGMHDRTRVKAYCYATTSSDASIHRQQIEQEAPAFHDASMWSVETLINQIVKDGIHILVNLNGYTRGAKNEVFAARPAPIHMSFMGFAGTLGAEWCDYVFADSISVLPTTLSSNRRNVDIEDRLRSDVLVEDQEDWMYAENIIFAKSTFFCVDHKQSAPDADRRPPASQDRASRDIMWKTEQDRRWLLRKELFPTLSDTAVILGNFNQLYKIDPATFRIYLRILASVPNSILWLLRFPEVGEHNLKNFAREWAGENIASRVIFTDVAPKGVHITRASIVDLFLDTPECNAHTTAADVIWSGTPIVTWARWDYKMCSRMASSIVASALPEGPEGDKMRAELLVNSDDEYERHAISLAADLRYPGGGGTAGRGRGRLMDLRRILWEGRWTSRLFDTKRWVRDLECAYWEAWRKWEHGEGGDIWL